MTITHGIALFFLLVFTILASVFNRFLWWLLVLGYAMALAWVAVTLNWELLFFPPLVIMGIASIIMTFITAAKGDLI